MKEKAVENSIIIYLRTIGAYVTKVHSGKMKKSYSYRKGPREGSERTHWIKLADEGTPDILACIKGKFIAIEVKKDEKEIAKWQRMAENDRRSAAQHHQHQRVREAGGETLVVCSIDDLEKDLKELGLIR